jgi:nitroreductase
MDFFEVVQRRRSIRKFTQDPVPEGAIHKSLQSAVLAPNSSNAQTWDFYWVQSQDKKQKLVEACLNQSAARTAAELLVIVASPKAWKRSQPRLIEWVKSMNAPKPVLIYYEKLIPSMYMWGILNILGVFKIIVFNLIGIFRPIMRKPATRRDIQEVAIKSAALAAENFVLAVTAQGYATCMMEGFDECRVKSLLKLKRSDRVVMVIGIGKQAEGGTWGPRYRLPLEDVVHRI